MSGGHYNYMYFKVDTLADDIEADFLMDGKYMTEDWSVRPEDYFGERPMVEDDYLNDASEEQRIIILKEIKGLVESLRDCAKRAKEIEWYMSGDTGADTYIERLNLKP